MQRKTLDQAIEYVIGLKSPVLIQKGYNYATFDCKVYGYFDIMFSHTNNKWEAFIDRSTWEKGADIQHLFFID